MKKKLLLNWVYYPPVGHAVEALKLAKGYSLANKNLDVYLLLNADTPTELADACPWIKKTYAISTEEVSRDGKKAKCLQKIPKNWDYVSHDNRAGRLVKGNDRIELVKTQEVIQKIFVAKVANGYVEQSGDYQESILPVAHNPKITLLIPAKAKEFAKKFKHRGPAIMIMLGGAKGLRQSPSVEMWLKICLALEKAIPNLKIYFTGVTKSDHHRTFTKDFTLDDVNFLIKNLKNAESAYNIGLWNQIALTSAQATRPLLRQLESLQAAMRSRSEVWETAERNLQQALRASEVRCSQLAAANEALEEAKQRYEMDTANKDAQMQVRTKP